jgi:hypothetical protein
VCVGGGESVEEVCSKEITVEKVFIEKRKGALVVQ